MVIFDIFAYSGIGIGYGEIPLWGRNYITKLDSLNHTAEALMWKSLVFFSATKPPVPFARI
ncbi:MAG: hypothetical protein ACUVWV_14995 [Thermodesulfobacteriota bacterium]